MKTSLPRCAMYVLRRSALACWFALGCESVIDQPTSTDVSGAYQDPISAPASPSFVTSAFQLASECGACHTQHEREWRQSAHARAMSDPVYEAMIRQQRLDVGPGQDRFCTQCHSAIGTRSGDVTPGFEFAELSAITREGVTCEACHAVVDLERPRNSGHVLDPSAPIQGPLRDPSPLAGHASAYSALLQEARFCAGCHDVFDDRKGFDLESPYVEWQASAAARKQQPCQTCHMPSYRGTATGIPGANKRRQLHRHTFTSVGPLFIERGGADAGLVETLHAASVELLRGSAQIELDTPSWFGAGDDVELGITLHNHIEGHAFPTGSSFNRQFWISVEVRDAQGALVYASGALDERDDLRDRYASDAAADPELVLLGKQLFDAAGRPTPFGWRAASIVDEASIPSGSSRRFVFRVATAAAEPGPLQVRARLRFRAYSPRLLRALDLDDLVEQLRVIDIDTCTTTLIPK